MNKLALTARALGVAVVLSASPRPSLAAAPPACTAPHIDATVKTAAVPDMPPMAVLTATTGSAIVQVDVDETGLLTRAVIAKSSGSPYLDQAALESARHTTYAPETNDCVPMAGSYDLIVDFAG